MVRRNEFAKGVPGGFVPSSPACPPLNIASHAPSKLPVLLRRNDIDLANSVVLPCT